MNKAIQRPKLDSIPLEDFDMTKPGVTVTMSEGQWDHVLQSSYDIGFYLLELDSEEKPIAVYRRNDL